MKAWNLTDVETVGLKAVGLVGVSITVGGVTIPSGCSSDVNPRKLQEREVRRFTSVGALHLGDEAPPAYVAAVVRGKNLAIKKVSKALGAAPAAEKALVEVEQAVTEKLEIVPPKAETKAERKRRIKAEKAAAEGSSTEG